MGQPASYEDWQRVYGDVYEALPERLEKPCPNCGSNSLRLEFVARESDHLGYAMFWCDFCLLGIHVSYTSVPRGVAFHLLDTPWSELGKTIPEYTIIYPADDSDEFDEGDVLNERLARPEQ